MRESKWQLVSYSSAERHAEDNKRDEVRDGQVYLKSRTSTKSVVCPASTIRRLSAISYGADLWPQVLSVFEGLECCSL